jgi:hypothetical protein
MTEVDVNQMKTSTVRRSTILLSCRAFHFFLYHYMYDCTVFCALSICIILIDMHYIDHISESFMIVIHRSVKVLNV